MTKILIVVIIFASVSHSFHFEIFRPKITDNRFSFVQGLCSTDHHLLLGTNTGSVMKIGKDETGNLKQQTTRSIGKRSVQQIHAQDDSIVVRMDTNNFGEAPFGESIVMNPVTLQPHFRLSHRDSHLIYDCMISSRSYWCVYANGRIRKCVWYDASKLPKMLHETNVMIRSLRHDERIHLAFHTMKRLFVITTASRLGWVDEDYCFHQMHDLSFLGMTTAMFIKQPREDIIFAYIGTLNGSVVFLQFNGSECIIRNSLQISDTNNPITQITSNGGQNIYVGTMDCHIVGFNMISFALIFHIQANYDQFHSNTDNFIVRKNSIITYDNKKNLICFIL